MSHMVVERRDVIHYHVFKHGSNLNTTLVCGVWWSERGLMIGGVLRRGGHMW